MLFEFLYSHAIRIQLVYDTREIRDCEKSEVCVFGMAGGGYSSCHQKSKLQVARYWSFCSKLRECGHFCILIMFRLRCMQALALYWLLRSSAVESNQQKVRHARFFFECRIQSSRKRFSISARRLKSVFGLGIIYLYMSNGKG